VEVGLPLAEAALAAASACLRSSSRLASSRASYSSWVSYFSDSSSSSLGSGTIIFVTCFILSISEPKSESPAPR
jgi:hypothetical protein